MGLSRPATAMTRMARPRRDVRVAWPSRLNTRGVASPARRPGLEAGQAAVELVAGLPALLLVAVVVMQLLAVGYTAVLAGDAAEAGALAIARGGAPEAAARSAIPGWARGGMQVRRAIGAVHVQIRPPRLVPWVGGLLRIRASAAVAAPGRTGLLP
jgi:hypothetical protein